MDKQKKNEHQNDTNVKFSFLQVCNESLPKSDSGCSGVSNQPKMMPFNGQRCRSTCSIVLSAITDFSSDAPPKIVPEEPIIYNATTTYVVPDQVMVR